jgi:hypothetical protein
VLSIEGDAFVFTSHLKCDPITKVEDKDLAMNLSNEILPGIVVEILRRFSASTEPRN